MKLITIIETNEIISSLIGEKVQIKPSSPAIFVFFGGNSETCTSNLYTMENWEILQKNKLLIRKGKCSKSEEKEITYQTKNLKLISILVKPNSLQLNLENDIEIKIISAGMSRTWEMRFKKLKKFIAASGAGEFTQANYINSIID